MALKFSTIATLLLFVSLSQPHLAIRQKELLWKGSARLYISNLTASQVWAFLEDYCNIHKVFPVTISFCVGGAAANDEAGRPRYLATIVPPAASSNSTQTTTVRWEEHSLIEMNSVKRFVTYEFLDNNQGVEMFKSTMQVVERKKGCELTWNYIVTPTLGYTNEAVLADFNSRLQIAVLNMKKATLLQV